MSDLDRLYGPNTRKNYSSPLMMGFGMSLLLLAGYVLGYWLFFLIFAGAFPETGSPRQVWIPPLAVGVTVSVIACIPMRYMKKPIHMALGMVFLAVYYGAVAVGLLTTAGTQDPGLALYVVSLFCLPCVIPGNIFAWAMWWRFRGDEEDEE